MIKKWSYVVAAAATVFGGSVLTGCIDNDEPFGITQIRVETANLLKAKQALVEADAAYKLAQAELEKSNAEIARINAEIQKAQAESQIKINELEAEAKAAKDKADAEKAQAQAEKAKAETEFFIKNEQAKLDKLIADNEARIKASQLKYEKALYAWEMWKLKDQNNASSILYQQLANAYSGYLWALSEYNTKAQQLVDEQKASAQWNNNLVWVDGENGEAGKWTHPQDAYAKGLKQAVKDQETNIKNTENAIATGEARIADLSNVETVGGVYDKWTELKEEYQANVAKIAELDVKFEETVRENEPLKKEIDALWDAYEAVGKKDIDIPAYTFEPTPALAAIGMDQPDVVVPEGETYTLEDYNNYQKYLSELASQGWTAVDITNNNYAKYVTAYKNQITTRKAYLLDQNDIAWTNARLNEMQRELKSVEGVFDAAKAQWETAKKVYNDGKEVVASALPGEKELEDAITAYNALEDELATLAENMAKAQKESEEAENAYKDAVKAIPNGETLNSDWEDAQADYATEMADAQKDYDAAEAAAAVKKANAEAIANQAITAAQNEKARLDALVEALTKEKEVNPDKEGLAAELEQAEKDQTAAGEAVTTATTNAGTAKENAAKEYNQTVAAANTTLVKEQNAAQEKLDKAQTKWVEAGLNNADLQALAKAVEEKSTALKAVEAEADEMKETGAELATAVGDAYGEQLKACNLPGWDKDTQPYYNIPTNDDVYSYINAINDGNEYTFVPASAPIYAEVKGIYANALLYLIESSGTAYGYLGNNGYHYDEEKGYWYEFNGTSHNVVTIEEMRDKAFLIPAEDITTEMLNAYVRSYVGWDMPDYRCVNYYKRLFANFGQVKYIENRIEVCKAYLENSDLSKTALETLEENLAALESSYKPVEEEQTKAYDAWDAKNQELEDLLQAIKDEKELVNKENQMINKIIEAIDKNFATLTDQTGWTATVSPSQLQGAIKDANDALEQQKANLEVFKANLEEAQKYLDLFNENPDNIYDFNPSTATINQLTAELKVAEESLAVLKARVDELQAKYEAAAKQ